MTNISEDVSYHAFKRSIVSGHKWDYLRCKALAAWTKCGQKSSIYPKYAPNVSLVGGRGQIEVKVNFLDFRFNHPEVPPYHSFAFLYSSTQEETHMEYLFMYSPGLHSTWGVHKINFLFGDVRNASGILSKWEYYTPAQIEIIGTSHGELRKLFGLQIRSPQITPIPPKLGLLMENFHIAKISLFSGRLPASCVRYESVADPGYLQMCQAHLLRRNFPEGRFWDPLSV